jgi:hypothetical protein
VAQLLNVKIIHFEGRMCHGRFLILFGRLDEESVVVGEFKASIDVKEASGRLPVFVQNIRRCEGEVLGVPIEHLLEHAYRVRNADMTPSVYGSRARRDTLQFAQSRFFIQKVDSELLLIWVVRNSWLLSIDKVDLVAGGVCQRDSFTATRSIQGMYTRSSRYIGSLFQFCSRFHLVCASSKVDSPSACFALYTNGSDPKPRKNISFPARSSRITRPKSSKYFLALARSV